MIRKILKNLGMVLIMVVIIGSFVGPMFAIATLGERSSHVWQWAVGCIVYYIVWLTVFLTIIDD